MEEESSSSTTDVKPPTAAGKVTSVGTLNRVNSFLEHRQDPKTGRKVAAHMGVERETDN